MYNKVRIITMPDGENYTVGHSDSTLYTILEKYCGYDFMTYIRDLLESFDEDKMELERSLEEALIELDAEEERSSDYSCQLSNARKQLECLSAVLDSQKRILTLLQEELN